MTDAHLASAITAAENHSQRPHDFSERSIHIFGNARVQLGDRYTSNRELFETGTEDEKRSTLLNLLYYDGHDLKRQQLALSDVGPRSFAWIEATSFPEWLRSDQTTFWITGKPGSGKSTLMKHLAESRTTLKQLNSGGHHWAVVHFFFDYRAGKAMANQLLGMLKLFLRQLSLTVKSVKEYLREDAVQQMLATDNIDQYITTISNTILNASIQICAFVDGLDEYDGDLWDLCGILSTLQQCTGMKLCLASRPERVFEVSFSELGCPSVTMQEHNHASIRLYMQRKIERHAVEHPFAEDMFWGALLEAITHKSEGVILWARLVVDEMLKTRGEDPSTSEAALFTYLERLPPELEPLYERILGKTNPKYQSEAAMVLQILCETEDGAFKAATLFQTWDFLNTMWHPERHSKPISFPVYEARTKALLGNLIDFVRPVRKPVSIRLLHRSLSTYLARTSWLSDRLSERFKMTFPNNFERRLTIMCLREAATQAKLDIGGLKTTLVGDISSSYQRKSFSTRSVASKDWAKWIDLLLSSIDRLVGGLDNQSSDAMTVFRDFPFWTELPADFVLLHYSRCKQCLYAIHGGAGYGWNNAILRIHKAGVLAILVLILHDHGSITQQQLDSRLPEMEIPTRQDLLECFVIHKVSQARRGLQRDLSLVSCFAKHSTCITPQHICYVSIYSLSLTGERLLDVLQNAAEIASENKSLHHHPNCPYANASNNILSHFLYFMRTSANYIFDQITKLARLCLTIGIDLNQPYEEGGEQLLHGLLTFVKTGALSFDDLLVQDYFLVMTSIGILPPAAPQRLKSLLDCARDLYCEAVVAHQREEKLVPLSPRSLVHEKLLGEVIRSVTYCSEHNGKWPENMEDRLLELPMTRCGFTTGSPKDQIWLHEKYPPILSLYPPSHRSR